MPDIFVNGGASDFANWGGLCADMSDQPWAADTDAAYVNDDGTVGFPYTVEAIGLAYNADILEKAGVDPALVFEAIKGGLAGSAVMNAILAAGKIFRKPSKS